MQEHAFGKITGDVPSTWLVENSLFICQNCSKLVACSHKNSHSRSCVCNHTVPSSPANSESTVTSPSATPFPSLEEVLALKQGTLKYIPSRARHQFAQVLAEALKDVIHNNNIIAWTRLLMLPKCILASSKRGGKKGRHKISIDTLCQEWSRGNEKSLWTAAVSRACKSHQSTPISQASITKEFDHVQSDHAKLKSAISCVREGLLSKACQILTSKGIAPDTKETFERLKAKHPFSNPPSVPVGNIDTKPVQLQADFNLLAVLRSFKKATACGPSGMRIQHFLDVASVPLPVSTITLLREVLNILLAGKAPEAIAPLLAGGSLTALLKVKGNSWDVRPIAVGEVIRRLASKCACNVVKEKASDFFSPFQFGVACPRGSEKIIHNLREVLEQHWSDPDFAVIKINMQNAFNLVSRDAVLQQCLMHFPEIYPWTSWCYSQHPKLWHPVGSISSASGVQQGDPLGPLLFALVLQSVLKKLAADPQCQQLLLNAWYLDDGALAGPGSAVLRALEVLGAEAKPNGLILNPSKCELFSPNTDTFQPFDSSIPTSTTPNFEILGAPIGSPEFCGEYIEAKRKQACSLLHLLPQLCDPQVSILLLRHCASFCKLSHLGCSVPPCDSSLRQFMLFDEDVLHCLEECAAFELTLSATKQVQLPLRHGGLGLTSVSNHSFSAFISSLSNAIDVTSAPNASHHLKQAFESVTSSPPQQHHLSGKIEDNSFQTLLINSTVCTRARLRAVSASNANAWLRAIPCIHNDLALEPQEMQVLLKWWLGLPVFSAESKCPFCSSALDPDCHHALTCRSGGDVIARHNKLRDCVANLCSKACLSPQLEKGAGIDFSRPADVLVPNWSLSNPAAFDLKVIHPLNTDLILEASLASGNSAEVGEIEKHAKNDQMCARLGWTCIPLVVEVYGGWGCEAKECYSRLSKRLAMQVGICETEALCQMYCLLAVTLMRQNARAILLRCARAPLLEY